MCIRDRGKAEANVVPLMSYDVYSQMRNDEGDSVDENNDGQISTEEIKKVKEIDFSEKYDVSDEDMACLLYTSLLHKRCIRYLVERKKVHLPKQT